MKTSAVIALVLAAAAAGGVAFFLTRSGSNASLSTSTPGAEPRLFPALEARINDVAIIEIRKGTDSAVLGLEDGEWRLISRDGFPAEFEKIKGLVMGLSKSTILEAKTSNSALYSRIGVEDPESANATSSLITLKDKASGVLASVIVGQRASDAGNSMGVDRGTFARRANEPESFLVKDLPAVDPTLMAWIKPEVLRIEGSRFASATISAPAAAPTPPATPPATDQPAAAGNPPDTAPPALTAPVMERITIEKTGDGSYALKELPAGKYLKQPSPLNQVANALAYVGLDDVAKADKVFSGDLEGVATAEFRTNDGLIITARLIEKDGKSWATFSAAADPAAANPAATSAATPVTTTEPQAPTPSAPAAANDQPAKPDAGAATSTPPAPSKAAAEADSLNKRLSGWAFALPSFKAQQLRTRLVDLVTDQAPAGPPSPEPDAATFPLPSPVPGGAGLPK